MLDTRPAYRPMLAVDLEKSAGRGDVAAGMSGRVLREAIEHAFAESQIDWTACHRNDTGDGVFVVVGPDVSHSQLIHPLVDRLAVLLRAHNQTAGHRTRLRVRVAVHAGRVQMDDGRMVGESLVDLGRLLDAPAVRDALAAAPESATVALVVSGHMYDEVVRHRLPGIDPDTYRRIDVRVKETSTTAWLHLPGHSSAVAAADRAAGPAGKTGHSTADQPAAAPPAGGVSITADSVNFAGGHARVGRQIGRVDTYIEHVRGDGGASVGDLGALLADLRRLLGQHRAAGDLDQDGYEDAVAQLDDAEANAAATDDAGSRRLIRALQRLKGLVEGIADLVSKVGAAIAAARDIR